MRFLGIDLDLRTPAERRELANALLRAAWSAALEDTRILLLDLLHEVHHQWRDRARNLPIGALSLGTGDPGELSEPAAIGDDEVEEVAAAHLVPAERVADLAALKPAERTALYPQALGYRYREIGAVTDASYTAANRRLTEGRAQLHGSPASATDNRRYERRVGTPRRPLDARARSLTQQAVSQAVASPLELRHRARAPDLHQRASSLLSLRRPKHILCSPPTLGGLTSTGSHDRHVRGEAILWGRCEG